MRGYPSRQNRLYTSRSSHATPNRPLGIYADSVRPSVAQPSEFWILYRPADHGVWGLSRGLYSLQRVNVLACSIEALLRGLRLSYELRRSSKRRISLAYLVGAAMRDITSLDRHSSEIRNRP